MLDFYPALIEAVIEFKAYSRQLICEYRKETYVKNPEDEVTDIPAGFKLFKHPDSEFIFCCKPGQNLKDRILEKRNEPFDPHSGNNGRKVQYDSNLAGRSIESNF